MSKIPIGVNTKCCWACRTAGSSLNLLPMSYAEHRFKENPTNQEVFFSCIPMDMKEILWANKTPKGWTLENGEELAWTCPYCAKVEIPEGVPVVKRINE